MTDDVDVVVTDGFTGNVVLKTLEGGMRTLVRALVAAFGSKPEYKPHADVLLPALLPLYEAVDPDTTGGAVLLGVDGVCIISGAAAGGHPERTVHAYGLSEGLCTGIEQLHGQWLATPPDPCAASHSTTGDGGVACAADSTSQRRS